MRTRLASFLRRSVVLGAVAAVTALSAAAQNITYTFTGAGSGTLGTQSFSVVGFSFTVTVPTSSLNTTLFGPGIPATGGLVMNFSINGAGSGTISDVYVFNNQAMRTVGFGSTLRRDLLNLENLPGLDTYGMITDYSPQTATGSNLFFGQFINQPTSLGNLSFTSVATATFQASTSDVGVVPEPSTYALLGTGLIALGSIARRRRTTA